MSSRDFNQDVGGAKRAALSEPVFITDRGKPTHVLMNFETFLRLTGDGQSIVDLLALPDDLSPDKAAPLDTPRMDIPRLDIG
ncbi:type II toxin-antitoxin system Phd/YefM family antitoxin [Nitrospirillum sp. BR 11828]|uniref:type II toxin-antitoxin system Phd/YefM family antitoxin n=1 Tax=Nitrospirillum sp. BR 11828 TaxID=3104325 RepID=UPI002ACAD3C3|nr:type II toxin-antitoxin system Phd/YefM family antitoxin [Nitrospirillum sp. BR 11828]MDZ5648750.1 type II toxin-antitoxin system Phd/YefM family antitoxin [Nitrospirillum sp. BR 11828]